MQKLVGVRFVPSGKVYFFDSNNLKLDVLDNVIVDTKFGPAFGQVAFCEREVDVSYDEEIKSVIRKATEADVKKHEQLKAKAAEDLKHVRNKVRKLGLNMKIVSAEYCFDASKFIIEFSADDRVDFRDLLKELANTLKVRIELHQIGQRDEVKIKGGLGPCGEVCCCNRFLKDFEHVTVKMAKTQGLSLSPTKISGLCGRLMCCLAYENKQYEEIIKLMPKVGSQISSPKGTGYVVYNDILRQRVSVKIKNNDDTFTVYDFSLEELEFQKQDKQSKAEPEKQKNKQENAEPKQENTENKQAFKPNKNNFKKHKNKNKHIDKR